MVSLASAERPNYFLVVSENSHLQMERWSQGTEFSGRATFIQHQGLFLPGHTSFELVGKPGIFLTLTRNAAQAQRYDASDGFKISSSFTLEGWNTHAYTQHAHTQMPLHVLQNEIIWCVSPPLAESSFVIPYRMMCEWRYQACASPCVHTCSDPNAIRCQFLPP